MSAETRERKELRIKLLELGGTISSCWGNTAGGKFDQERAEREVEATTDAILAAGYRKPRTITTAEELDALPAWTVVRSEQATIWEKFKGNVSDFWAESMTLGKHPSDHIALPATVLYEPEPQP